MSVSAIVNAAGADFMLLGPKDTMVKSTKPVIAVGAVRTGCGKSQTSRKVIEYLLIPPLLTRSYLACLKRYEKTLRIKNSRLCEAVCGN